MSRIQLDGYSEGHNQAVTGARPASAAQFSALYVDRDIEAAIRRLPPLPTTLGDLVDKLNNPDSSIRDITSRIKTDPSLTTRLLRMANSAFYGARSYITDVDRAVITLGFRTTRNLVAAAAVASHFSAAQDPHSFGPQGMYKHSLATAVFCQLAAAQLGPCGLTPEEFFVAGLLHDIGRIPLAQYYRRHQREFAAQPHEIDELFALERELFGVDHTAVGGMVADHWRLPAPYRDMIVHHHDVAAAESPRLAALVALADRWVNGQGIGRTGPFATADAVILFSAQSGLDPARLPDLAALFRREFELYLMAM